MSLRKCSTCGTSFERKGTRTYCTPCERAYQQEYRVRPEAVAAAKVRKAALYTDPVKGAELRARILAYRKTPHGAFTRFQYKVRAYGIEVEDWARMYDGQKRQCATCPRALTFDRFTHIDHDHVTGEVRGLLCHNCNCALGHAKDNPEVLRALALYVEARR